MTGKTRRWRMRLGSVFVAVLLAPGVIPAATAFAGAASSPALPRAVTEGPKVILDDTSVNAPGFYSNSQVSSKAVIAWTGTDPDHHLNVMTSSDGLH